MFRGDVEANSIDDNSGQKLRVFPDTGTSANNGENPCCESLYELVLHGRKVY